MIDEINSILHTTITQSDLIAKQDTLSRLTIKDAKNPRWADAEHQRITVTVAYVGYLDEVFHETTYGPEADTEHGRELYKYCLAEKFGRIAEYIPPSDDKLREWMLPLTARQLRLGLLSIGKLSTVSAAIAALPEPARTKAEIEWEFASQFHRTHALIHQLTPVLGLTEKQVDGLWMKYSTV